MSSAEGSVDIDLAVRGAVAALRAALPLTTARCTLREVGADDAGALHAYRSDPEITRFLGHPPLDAAGVRELLQRWEEDPTGVSIVAELHGRVGGPDTGLANRPAGGADTGLADRLVEGPDAGLAEGLTPRVLGDVRVRFRRSSAMAPATTSAVDAALGYAFHPAIHGRGLATECVRAVLGATVGAAGARRVTARVFAPAAPSARLLARLGFTRDGVDRAAVLAPDGTTWWDDELWSLLPDDGSMP